MKRNSEYFLSPRIKILFETPVDYSHFFGYYTCSPIDHSGKLLHAHQNRAKFDGRAVTKNDTVEVGFYEIDTGKWNSIGETRAFNWQQGAMLQWLGSDGGSRIIYNDQEGNKFVARIVDISNNQRRTIPHAIYAVHPSGNRALGVVFERHYYCRAYHYEGIADENWNLPLHPDDGILDIDLLSGKASRIINTADIAAFGLNAESIPHWLEHIIWNPSGTRFAFLHRYGTNQIYTTRVFTANSDGSDLFCLPDYERCSYTHMGWRSENSFVIHRTEIKPIGQAYASLSSSSNPFLSLPVTLYRSIKKFIPKNLSIDLGLSSGYAYFQDKSQEFNIINNGLLREDGHPSWTKDGRFMLTDTYADSSGYRYLLLFNIIKNQVYSLGKFFSPLNNSSYRCDLHPRFSRKETEIIIDTAHSGQHQIMVFSVNLNEL